MRRISLIGSIMSALSAVNPFATGDDIVTTIQKKRKPKSLKHYAKPPTKAKFKQNQRKQRKASARKKARR